MCESFSVLRSPFSGGEENRSSPGKSTREILQNSFESYFRKIERCSYFSKARIVTKLSKAPSRAFPRREDFLNRTIHAHTQFRAVALSLSLERKFSLAMCETKRSENFQLCFGCAGGINSTFYFVKLICKREKSLLIL